MKKVGILLLALVMLLLAGCGSSGADKSGGETTTAAAAEQNGDVYFFKVNGTEIRANAEAAPIIEALGEPLEYFESESCAFQGLDKIYTYGGFRIYTYPVDDVDYIQNVELVDDSVSTQEGIYIGSSADDVKKAYGESDEVVNAEWVYKKGDSTLHFIFTDDKVVSIEYRAITD